MRPPLPGALRRRAGQPGHARGTKAAAKTAGIQRRRLGPHPRSHRTGHRLTHSRRARPVDSGRSAGRTVRSGIGIRPFHPHPGGAERGKQTSKSFVLSLSKDAPSLDCRAASHFVGSRFRWNLAPSPLRDRAGVRVKSTNTNPCQPRGEWDSARAYRLGYRERVPLRGLLERLLAG